MKQFLLRAATLVAALICGTIGGIAVFPMGLALSLSVIWPLTFVVAAMFAAGGAVGVGSILGSRPLLVIIASQVAAIFAAIFVLTVAIPTVMQTGGWVHTYHRVYLLGAGIVVIGLAASWAAWRFGSTGRGVSRRGLLGRALMMLGLIVLAVVVEAPIIYAWYLWL
jgi:hypothetical protein